MKKSFLLLILSTIITVFFVTGCKTQQNNGAEEPVISKFDQVLDFLERKLSESGVPGGAIAVITNGTLSHSAGVGVRRQGTNDPVDSNTLFNVCSTGKMLTAGAIMTLVQENKIDLYAPVTDYVPYFQLLDPYDPSGINLHQILTHSSGFPDFLPLPCDGDANGLSRWWRENTETPLWSLPGVIWLYSNPGYSLSGLILEEAAGISFIEAVKQRIFDPVGMTGTVYEAQAVTDNGNYAVGHTFKDNGEVDSYVEPDDCAFLRPAGGAFASVVDMARFIEMLLSGGGDVLTSASVERMMAPHIYTRHPGYGYYGYGLQSFDYKGLNVVMHPGSTNAYSAAVYLVPGHNFGVVVMLNATLYNPHTIAKKAIDIFLDLPDTPAPDYSTSPDSWHIYTGSYFDPYNLGAIDVYQDSENQLWVNFIDHGHISQLSQEAGDWFWMEKNPAQGIGTSNGYCSVTFFPDETGTIEYFVTRLGVGKRLGKNTK